MKKKHVSNIYVHVESKMVIQPPRGVLKRYVTSQIQHKEVALLYVSIIWHIYLYNKTFIWHLFYKVQLISVDNVQLHIKQQIQQSFTEAFPKYMAEKNCHAKRKQNQ